MRHVVATHAGISKTGVLLTSDGETLARVRTAGTHPHVNGMAASASVLAAAVRSAATHASATPVSLGALKLANINLPEDEAAWSCRRIRQRSEPGQEQLVSCSGVVAS